MVQSRSVDGFRFLEGWTRDSVTIEVHTDGYLQPIRFTVDRGNVGLNMIEDIFGAMEDHLGQFHLRVAGLIHYPECWDTVAYPTLYSAVHEILSGHHCSTCGDLQGHEGPRRTEMGVD